MATVFGYRPAIALLAFECRDPETLLKGAKVCRELEEIFEAWPEFEDSLLSTQREYMECIDALRQLPEGVRLQIHAALKARTQFERFSILAEKLDLVIASKRESMDKRSEDAKGLKNRLQSGHGNKMKQRASREEILRANNDERGAIAQIEELRKIAADKAAQGKIDAGFTKRQLGSVLEEDAFAIVCRVGDLIAQREALKIDFFLRSDPLLIVDCEAQNRFDAILRSAIKEPSIWEKICNCWGDDD